ncbi:endothelin-converting enzyme 1-like isoform X2 [Microplitis mediator]|nr:endothelin-converting enzyme 1-like isoform X2 [Microplitis mediator]
MNQSMDPCNDFFNYACGNWHNGLSHQSHFHILTNETSFRLKEIFESPRSPDDTSALTKAKKIYKTCMNEDFIEKRGITDLVELIDNISGWPMAMSTYEWLHKKISWQEIDKTFRQILGNSPLFNLKVLADVENSTNNIITIAPPIEGIAEYISPLVSASLTLNQILNLPSVMKYHSIIEDSCRLIARHRGSYVLEKNIKKDAQDIVSFEWSLKIISTPSNNFKLDVDSMFEKMTIKNFQRFYNSRVFKSSATSVKWIDVIKDLFAEAQGVNIEESEVIAVVDKNYFIALAYLINRTPIRTIVNTMHWWLIRNLGTYTNKQMSNLIDNVLPGGLSVGQSKSNQDTPRWYTCTMQNEMTHAYSYAYVKKYFPRRAQQIATELVHKIINGMRRQIENSKWLDDYSKEGALKKVQTMKEFIGFPHWYDDPNAVDNYYKDIKPSIFYFKNILMMFRLSKTEELKLLRERVTNNKWVGSPVDVNAFYLYTTNSITIPAGILQVPFFEDDQPDALNYGGLGTIIGHEISHGFDDVGSQFNNDGNAHNWWSNSTKAEYKRRAQCFVDEFDKYSFVHDNNVHKVDAQQTLTENIADSTGVRAVFEAFKRHADKSLTSNMKLPGLEHLNSYQLFFLSYAHMFCTNSDVYPVINQLSGDAHSPAAFRIAGTLSNIEGFAETFKCPRGTRMNPIEKCSIW